MPIGGFVVNILQDKKEEVIQNLERFSEVTIYGHDDQGHLIVVLESETLEDMEALLKKLSNIEGIVNFNLAYLHGEDEVEKIERGEIKPQIRFCRKAN